jgi:hypothetical protein
LIFKYCIWYDVPFWYYFLAGFGVMLTLWKSSRCTFFALESNLREKAVKKCRIGKLLLPAAKLNLKQEQAFALWLIEAASKL